jgi:DNA-binding winged helix-turn-helix (wHTH) protein/tetratricopeptide (TPR) repeat protein
MANDKGQGVRDKGHIIFDPFRLDLINQCLWRGEHRIPLMPKDFAVLRYLAEHPGRLVTKEELLQAVWAETTVGEAVLKVCMRRIRQALGDDPKSPQFIETAHRRGYRFIGKIRDQGSGIRDQGSGIRAADQFNHVHFVHSVHDEEQTHDVDHHPPPAINLVGREAELAQLERWWEKARHGDRQVVFVTGEPGIGKTTLVEALLEQAAAAREIGIARGQCLEQYGVGEAYLPVLEALGRLCREPGQERVLTLLSRHAPTWLAQMPSLIPSVDRDALQRDILGATPERMLREMSEAIEALTAQTPVILVLEDLHWSDYSTLNLISSLARRREPARLLVIGTYRPVEVILSEHPLKAVKQELQLHRYCEELPLELLSQEAVTQYLVTRFEKSADSRLRRLARAIYERTGGNPLFMVNVVDYLVTQGLIAPSDEGWTVMAELEEIEVGVPESIRQMIEKQIERLAIEDQQVLEAASVAGAEFSAAAVAAALDTDVVQTEERCENLARRQQFLRPTGVSEYPDGTVAARYGFIHSLYQNVLYQRVTATRRARFHQRIGERGEIAFGDRVGEIAAELAMHFEQARDYRRAVKYLRQAAENATRRSANREAIDYLTRALELVDRLPEAERAGERMVVLEQRGLARRAMGDMAGAAEEFEALAACARTERHLYSEAKAVDYLASSLSWFDRERCLAVVEHTLALSRHVNDELLRAHTRGSGGYGHFLLKGWRDADARACAEAIAAARRAGDRVLLSRHVGRYAYFQYLRSEYDAACRTAEEGAQLALEMGDAHEYLLCQFRWAWALLHLGEWGKMRHILNEGILKAEKNGHDLWAMHFQLEMAWLHEEAFDFERARALCEGKLKEAQEDQFGQFLSLVLLGWAHLGLKRYEEAFGCFNETLRRLERGRTVMDWIWQMLLRYGLSRYWLTQSEYARARQEAERLCALAAQPGERTYLALGRRMLAEVAMAERNWDQAEAEIGRALAVLEGVEAPLAEWRVYATAAQLHERQGRKAEADSFWAQGVAVLNRLADSLKDTDPLRQSLLARPSG